MIVAIIYIYIYIYTVYTVYACIVIAYVDSIYGYAFICGYL